MPIGLFAAIIKRHGQQQATCHLAGLAVGQQSIGRAKRRCADNLAAGLILLQIPTATGYFRLYFGKPTASDFRQLDFGSVNIAQIQPERERFGESRRFWLRRACAREKRADRSGASHIQP